MLKLQAITAHDREILQDTSYGSLANDEWKQLLLESVSKSHNHRYFELFKVIDGDTVVGCMNLYAHSQRIISCGPEIKPQYRKQGYAYEAETLALEMAKAFGFTIAVAYIRETNSASIRLHEKLGFELDQDFVNAHKKEMRLYIKAL